MLRGLPPFPALEPLEPVATAAGIWTLPWGRAPGPESWTADDLRLWPPHLVSALVALFRAVEQFGRWPLGLAAADVVLLPKPGACADEVLQRRPVTLLPVIYRLRARLRLHAVDAWRAQWGPAVEGAPQGLT